jgi:hypothetical protein
VLQLKVALVPYGWITVHELALGDRTQNSYRGLVHPDAVALMVTVVPARAVVTGVMDMLTEAQGEYA